MVTTAQLTTKPLMTAKHLRYCQITLQDIHSTMLLIEKSILMKFTILISERTFRQSLEHPLSLI